MSSTVLQLYSVSGSPFGWKVQLALEHLRVPYATTFLSADAGDLRNPSFLARNPHGKVPVIVDGSLTLFESDVVVEYLEDTRSTSETSLWPKSAPTRALARRVSAEASSYVYPLVRILVTRWANASVPGLDRVTLDSTKQAIATRLGSLALTLSAGFVAGPFPGAADYALYPLVALLRRLDARRPGEMLFNLVPEAMQAWCDRIERLDYFPKTYPPHWRT
jgi:glutathione S-transferase